MDILRNYPRDLELAYMFEKLVIIMFFQCSKKNIKFLINIIFFIFVMF